MSLGFPKDRRPIVISGPSGAGKGTLINKLRQLHPDVFATTVSHTTRKPRTGEENGVAYHFVSEAEFQKLIAEDAFVEHTVFSGNHYGTSKATIQEQSDVGHVVLLDIELQGVLALKSDPEIDARYVFIRPPSLEILEARLRGRQSDSEAAIEKRLRQARIELEHAETPGFHDRIVTNDDLERALQDLDAYIYSDQV